MLQRGQVRVKGSARKEEKKEEEDKFGEGQQNQKNVIYGP